MKPALVGGGEDKVGFAVKTACPTDEIAGSDRHLKRYVRPFLPYSLMEPIEQAKKLPCRQARWLFEDDRHLCRKTDKCGEARAAIPEMSDPFSERCFRSLGISDIDWLVER